LAAFSGLLPPVQVEITQCGLVLGNVFLDVALDGYHNLGRHPEFARYASESTFGAFKSRCLHLWAGNDMSHEIRPA
jgi:hypothetical protein